MREKLTALSSEEKMKSLFDQWDKNHDNMIDVHEFKKAMGDLDPRTLRCVSPPGVERSAAQAAILSRRLYALLLAVLRKRFVLSHCTGLCAPLLASSCALEATSTSVCAPLLAVQL